MKPRIVLSFVLLISFVFGTPALADDAPTAVPATELATAEAAALESTEEADVVAVQAQVAPFGTPVFVDTPGACLGSEAPTPIAAAGLMGCPFGPTCYSDAQCAFICGGLGTGVCGPDFCCWCIAG